MVSVVAAAAALDGMMQDVGIIQLEWMGISLLIGGGTAVKRWTARA